MRAQILKRRPGRSFAVLLLVALIATACATAGETGGDGGQATGGDVKPRVPKEPTKPVTITYAGWVSDSPLTKQLKKEFEKLHPNITVELQQVPSGQAREKYLTQIAGATTPDVGFMDASWVEEFASRGALLNLDAYIAGSEDIKPDDYVGGFKTSVLIENSMFGLPYSGETTGLFYRKDLFQQAGIEQPPATWEELEQTAAQLTDPANKTYGFAVFAPEAAYYWYPFLWAAGGELLSEDGKDVAFDSPEGKRAAEFYVRLSKYTPPDYLGADSWSARVAFATGKVAMYTAGAWFGGQMKTEFPQINGKWATAPLPEGPEGCATHLAGDALAIFEDTEHADAAWLWIEFLSREDNLKAYTYGQKTSTLLPPRQSLLDDPQLGKFNPWLKGFADNMKCAVTDPITQPAWPQIEEKLNQNLGKAMYGEMSPAEAVEDAAKEGEQLIQDQ